MSIAKIEDRLRMLEAEVAQLKAKVEGKHEKPEPWWKQIWGTFANDPLHEEAVRLGREYRESLRPKSRKPKKKKKNADS